MLIKNGSTIKPHNNQSGFTLIEIIIVIVITSIIAGIAAIIILQGVRAYQTEVSYSDIHNQGRLAIERMAREIRMTRSCNDITGPSNPDTDLQFVDVAGNAIRFLYSSPNLQRNENGGTLWTLANNVQSATFNYYDRNNNLTTSCTSPNDIWFIQIDLTTVNTGETLPLRVRVHPRSF